MGREALGLYVHIPFCKVRCRYCDFNTYSGQEELIPEYVQALVLELGSWRTLSLPVRSLYFGGGTPALLPAEDIRAILEKCRASLCVTEGAETTFEANPGALSQEYLDCIRVPGINRLSLGVQSFDNHLLKILGRLHSASEAREAFIFARRAGFDNVSLDLIYGLPAQTLRQWEISIEEAIELGPEHLSLYALTLEEHTPLYHDICSGKMAAPDADTAADMYLLAEDRLGRAGYAHYEISNWALPGRESVHNLNYWRSGPYIGIGAGAHSYLNGERFWNVARTSDYIRRIREEGKAVLGSEPISAGIERADYIILGLRLVDGLDLREFKIKYGEASHLYADEISRLAEIGLLEIADGKLRLTPQGRLLGNEVFQHFLPETAGSA